MGGPKALPTVWLGDTADIAKPKQAPDIVTNITMQTKIKNLTGSEFKPINI